MDHLSESDRNQTCNLHCHLISDAPTHSSTSSSQCLFLQLISALFFSSIIIGTIFGNILVIVSVLRFRYLRASSSNYLICSLALTDLVVGLVLMPLKAFNEVYNFGYWNYGYRLCLSWLFLAILCSTASSFHLLFIAIDRYLAINHRYPISSTSSSLSTRTNGQQQHQLNRLPSNTVKLSAMIAFSWAISFGIALLPLTVWIDEQHFRERIQRRICFPSQKVLYKIFSQIVVFYGPIAIMIPLYVSIYMKSRRQCFQYNQTRQGSLTARLKSSSEKSSGSSGTSDQPVKQDNLNKTTSSYFTSRAHKSRREYRVAKTLLTVMLAYIIFLAPFYLTTLISSIMGQKSPPKLLYSLALWTLYCNSLVNPIIYAFLNRNFARAFKQLLNIH